MAPRPDAADAPDAPDAPADTWPSELPSFSSADECWEALTRVYGEVYRLLEECVELGEGSVGGSGDEDEDASEEVDLTQLGEEDEAGEGETEEDSESDGDDEDGDEHDEDEEDGEDDAEGGSSDADGPDGADHVRAEWPSRRPDASDLDEVQGCVELLEAYMRLYSEFAAKADVPVDRLRVVRDRADAAFAVADELEYCTLSLEEDAPGEALEFMEVGLAALGDTA